jgi:hypothetical protein
MDAIERAVVAPQIELIEKRATWRQIFRDRPPLASRAQNIHDPVHHFALVPEISSQANTPYLIRDPDWRITNVPAAVDPL